MHLLRNVYGVSLCWHSLPSLGMETFVSGLFLETAMKGRKFMRYTPETYESSLASK